MEDDMINILKQPIEPKNNIYKEIERFPTSFKYISKI